MRAVWIALVSVGLAPGGVPPARGADLGKIDRTINKEPAYRAKPKYCLLVFGPEARTKVWLVLDGDVLYVDRNGNGDLTEPGEKVTAEKSLPEGPDTRRRTFLVGEVRDGGRRHCNLSVWVQPLTDYVKESSPAAKALVQREPQARAYTVRLDVEVPGRLGPRPGGRLDQVAGPFDANGILQLSDQPGKAPVIHFGGPWTMMLYGRPSLWLERSEDLVATVGTPGLGAGSFAYVGYEGVVPEGVAPRADITFPPARPGDPKLTASYDLPDRC